RESRRRRERLFQRAHGRRGAQPGIARGGEDREDHDLLYSAPPMSAALGIFLAVLSTLILPLPEELALLGAGWLAHSGALPRWSAWLAAWSAIVAGDSTTYLVGRFFLSALIGTPIGQRVVSPELRAWGEELVRGRKHD